MLVSQVLPMLDLLPYVLQKLLMASWGYINVLELLALDTHAETKKTFIRCYECQRFKWRMRGT